MTRTSLLAVLLAAPTLAAAEPKVDVHGEPLPEGAVARFGTTRLRAGPAAWAAFAADGKTIVTLTAGRVVRTWDAATGELLKRHDLPVEGTSVGYFNLTGTLAAIWVSGPESALEVWDVEAAKRLRRQPLPERAMLIRAAFSPDGKTLATAISVGSRLVLWDLADGTSRELARGGKYHAFHFSPDGRKLLTTLGNGKSACLDVATGDHLWQVKALADEVAFTADSKLVVVPRNPDRPDWLVLDADTGKPAAKPKLPRTTPETSIVLGPDGRTMLLLIVPNFRTHPDGLPTIRVWDLAEGKETAAFVTDSRVAVFAPDGKSVLTYDGSLQRWDLATGKPMFADTAAMGHTGDVNRLAFSRDGRRLASLGDDMNVWLWDVPTARPLHLLRSPEHQYVHAAGFTPDGRRLVTGGTDSALRVWDVETGRHLRRMGLEDPDAGIKEQQVFNLRVPDDRTAVAITCGFRDLDTENWATTWDLDTGRRLGRARLPATDSSYAAFTPDGKFLVSSARLYDLATSKELLRCGVKQTGSPSAVSPDGRLAASVIVEQTREEGRYRTEMLGFLVWEVASGRTVRRVERGWLGQIAFSPGGRHVAAADRDGIRLWDLATGEPVRRHKAPEGLQGSFNGSFASSMAFAPDGRTIATGHKDTTALLWDMTVEPPKPADGGIDGEALWADLLEADAAKAYAAVWRLAEEPGRAVELLRARLRPAEAVPAERLRQLVADLDDGQFKRREEAAAELRRLGTLAESGLRESLKGKLSFEQSRRVEKLLDEIARLYPVAGEELRGLRAVGVLERVGTAEARELLKGLAAGAPAARLTREAKAAFQRTEGR